MPQMLHGSGAMDDGADDSEYQHFTWPLAIASVAAAVAGMGLLGWFGSPWSLVVALVIVEAGAIAAGWVEARIKGSGLRSRLVAALTWSIFGVSCAAATMWYAEGRSSIWNVELLIPLGIGLVPLGVIRLVFWLVTRKRAPDAGAPQPRSPIGVVEVALAALVLAVPVAGWAIASKTIGGVQAKAERDHTRHVLTFQSDGQGNVTYQGEAVDRDAIADLCRQAAAEDPRTEVMVKTPEKLDNAAIGKVGFGAMSAGLSFSALPAH
jgi:cytochrome b561